MAASFGIISALQVFFSICCRCILGKVHRLILRRAFEIKRRIFLLHAGGELSIIRRWFLQFVWATVIGRQMVYTYKLYNGGRLIQTV